MIDASSLIRLSQDNPQARYPKIWDRFEELIEKGLLRAPREVRLELERGDDELANWAKTRFALFVDPQIELKRSVWRRFFASSRHWSILIGPAHLLIHGFCRWLCAGTLQNLAT